MVTRFVPGGYQPEHGGETTAQRVRRAVEGLGELIDDYEFHYPGELSPANLDEVRDALGGHGIYTICTGLHLDPRFGRGGLTSPDQATRAEALRLTLEAADFAGSLGANFVLWPGIEGYNYPFQTPYADSWAWFVDGVGQAAEVCARHGIKLFLEHKNSEPAMKMRAHRDLIRGPVAADSMLMRLLPGWTAKGGAEGLLCAVTSDWTGIAVKVEDGAQRAVRPAVAMFLRRLGHDAHELGDVPVRNSRGETVGELRVPA